MLAGCRARLSLLPLSARLALGDAGFMSKAARHANPVRQILRKVSAIHSEFASAQRRLAEISTARDRYMLDPDRPPDTYAEFLNRTAGVLRREPSARARTRSGR